MELSNIAAHLDRLLEASAQLPPGLVDDHTVCEQAIMGFDGEDVSVFTLSVCYATIVLADYISTYELDAVPFNHLQNEVDMALFGDYARQLLELVDGDEPTKFQRMVNLIEDAPDTYGIVLLHAVMHLSATYGPALWREGMELWRP